MQTAIEEVHLYPWARGLGSAPEKLALLALSSGTPQRRKWCVPDPELNLAGNTYQAKPVPKVNHLRILGLTIPQVGSGLHTIAPPQRTLSKTIHVIHPVSNRRFGLQEWETLRMVQAMLVTRIAYGAP